MATPCILYPLEQPSLAPAERSRNSGQTAVRASISDLHATLQDLSNVAADVPAEVALRLEIDKLCSATLVIDQAFHDIGRRLSAASEEQKEVLDLHNTCLTLETRWNEHHRTYQILLWRSREFAGRAQGAVDDFRDLVLPSLKDRDVTLSEKQEIIREQLELLQNIAQPSQALSQEFLDFGRTLDMYIAGFTQVFERFRIGEQSQKVSELGDELENARAAMEVANQKVKELGKKLPHDIAIIGVEFLLALVAPEWWLKLVGTAVTVIHGVKVGQAFIEARKEYAVAAAACAGIKAEYELGNGRLGQMAKLGSTLNDSKPLVQEVTVRLGIFASVWAIITADIRQLQSVLHYAEDPKSLLFISRVRKLEKLYGYLSQALRRYQVTITFVPP